MGQGFRIIVETFDSTTNRVNNRIEIKTLELVSPKHISDVGFKHIEQIEILQKILDCLVTNQCALLDEENDCPNCGSKTKKAGKISSHFHSIYTDHKVNIVRRICQCGWGNKSTIEGKFGSSSHPDLLKMQCELGAEHSYSKAQALLTKRNARHRPVNNHMHIARNIDKVGEILSNLKCAEPKIREKPAATIIAQVDGGHIASKDKNKRSYEALVAKVYNLENLIVKDERSVLMKSTCVASVLSDKNLTMKKQIVFAAKCEGMIDNTAVYAIADGAKNCWTSLNALKKDCKQMTMILDWCHIGRKFKNVQQVLPEEFYERLDSAKWSLWHGKSEMCLEKIKSMMTALSPDLQYEKLNGLYKYLKSNIDQLINYEEQKNKNLPFTSSIIESAVDTLINDRQARTKKMQWTREGAHHVLQIRASKASKTWDNDWDKALAFLLAA